MTEALVALSPETVDERVRLGPALLIAIREADEFARRRQAGEFAQSHVFANGCWGGQIIHACCDHADGAGQQL